MSSKYARSDIKLREIEELIQEGKMDNANRQLELLKKKKDFSQDHQLKYLLFKSQINIKMKKFEEGLKLARNAMEKCQKYGTPLLKVDACIREAEALEGLKIFNESLDVIDKGNRILKEIKIESDSSITTRKATLLYLRGKIHIAKDDLDQALTLFQQSLSLRKEIGDSFLIAESLNGIGRIYSSKDIHEKALDYFKKSISLLKKVGITKELAWTFWNIGSIYCKKGSLDKSLEYFQLSNEHFDKIGDKEGNGQALYCMSATTHDKGELNLALEYQRLSLNLYKDLGYNLRLQSRLLKLVLFIFQGGSLILLLNISNKV